ncbi:DUF3489 domain-containing protein [Bradyrhizobium sp. NBAIM20]|uniref:DUF3489 domain-containing protein n=1 Tax=Bradyrhizobium sp. NBAIM20 TaxID=2793811 RepID=UPI001CD73926|nr:DUF3489 domain-containing protein [Bradyrhizobium sp. NBAIM20]MCA1462525.1 DUF3489 domain-containing protein [Bradyrhizobium sp. NBAIM18]
MSGSKEHELLERLNAGWCEAPILAQKFGWRPHTLRGALSKLAKKHHLKIERRRESGINLYRVVQGEPQDAE